MIYFCSMIFRVFVAALFLYFLYRFIFHFLIPVSRTAVHMKQKINEFQNQMKNNGFNTHPQPNAGPQTQPNGGEYIEFEEVK